MEMKGSRGRSMLSLPLLLAHPTSPIPPYLNQRRHEDIHSSTEVDKSILRAQERKSRRPTGEGEGLMKEGREKATSFLLGLYRAFRVCYCSSPGPRVMKEEVERLRTR